MLTMLIQFNKEGARNLPVLTRRGKIAICVREISERHPGAGMDIRLINRRRTTNAPSQQFVRPSRVAGFDRALRQDKIETGQLVMLPFVLRLTNGQLDRRRIKARADVDQTLWRSYQFAY